MTGGRPHRFESLVSVLGFSSWFQFLVSVLGFGSHRGLGLVAARVPPQPRHQTPQLHHLRALAQEP